MSYLASFPDTARLCDIIIPGSHDAGMHTEAITHVQTQDVGIGEQAKYGCRFFDLRIGNHKTKAGIVLEAYHADKKLVVKKTDHMKLIAGGWGDSLHNMLNDAAAFVTSQRQEFLILKFSKCMRPADVAQSCLAILGPVHFKAGGKGGSNLNVMPIGDLRGKVITIFDDKEDVRDSLKWDFEIDKGTKGILLCRGLFKKNANRTEAYDSSYPGLQYFGKYSNGTDPKEILKIQVSRFQDGPRMNSEVLGMMYWTTTGLLGSIKEHDAGLWADTSKLTATWQFGLKASIESQLGSDAKRLFGPGKLNPAGLLKTFMPNIVMMDFVDKERCDTIMKLNTVADHDLRAAMQKLASAAPPRPSQPLPASSLPSSTPSPRMSPPPRPSSKPSSSY